MCISMFTFRYIYLYIYICSVTRGRVFSEARGHYWYLAPYWYLNTNPLVWIHYNIRSHQIYLRILFKAQVFKSITLNILFLTFSACKFKKFLYFFFKLPGVLYFGNQTIQFLVKQLFKIYFICIHKYFFFLWQSALNLTCTYLRSRMQDTVPRCTAELYISRGIKYADGVLMLLYMKK